MAPIAHRIITPIIGTAVVLVPLSYCPALRDHTLGPKLLLFQLLIILTLGTWLLKRNLRLPSLVLPALLYVLIGLTSTLYATNPALSLLEGTKHLTGFLFFLILANHLTPKNIPLILTASIWTGILIALLGIGDYLGWRPVDIPSSGLPSATLGFRNIAAMYLIQNLPFAVAMFALAKARPAAYLNALSIALMGAFLIYTRTRGAWLGLFSGTLVTCILWWYYAPKEPRTEYAIKKWPILVAVSTFTLLVSLPSGLTKQGPQSIDEKKTSVHTALTSMINEGGDRGRLSTWKRTLPMIADHPILGVGQGNWQIHYPRYDGGTNITFGAAPERPHNNWLQIFAETGIVGLILYSWFCSATIRKGWQLLKTPDLHTRWIAAACLTSFIAILIHSFFSFPSERITPTLFFWLVPGIIAAQSHKDRHLKPVTATPTLVVLFLISLAQIAFTYRLVQFDKYMHRAVGAERNADWKTVLRETQHAETNGTFHREAAHLRGYALNTEGLYAEALDHYQKAITQNPYDLQILNGLAIAAQNLGQPSKAETHYRKALELVDSSDIRYNLAGLYLQFGRAREAIVEYNRIAQIENPSLDLFYHLLHAYLFALQTDKTAEIMQQALDLAPKATDHFKWIEHFYQRHHKAEIARTCYTLLIAQWTGLPEQMEPAHKRLGQLETLP